MKVEWTTQPKQQCKDISINHIRDRWDGRPSREAKMEEEERLKREIAQGIAVYLGG